MNNKTGIWLSGAFALISGIASVVMILLDIGRLAALPVIASAAAFIYITTVLFKSSGLYAKGSGQFGISNESWRIILDSMPVHFFVKDADKEFVYILSNQKTGNLLGIKGRDMIGKTDAQIFPDRENADDFKKWDEKVMNSGDGVSFTEEITDCEGRLHRMHTEKKAFTTKDGRRLLVGISSDISHLYNLIESEQLTGEALRQISTEPDFNTNLQIIGRNLRDRIDCDRIIIGEWHGVNTPLSIKFEWMNDGIKSIGDCDNEKFDALKEMVSVNFTKSQIYTIPDIEKSEFAPLLSDSKAKSVIAVPISVEGKPWGELIVSFMRRKRIFSEVDIGLMSATANIISLALNRERQSLQISRAKKILQAMMDNLPVSVAIKDADDDFRCIMCNPEFCKEFGCAKSEIVGKITKEMPFFKDKAEEFAKLDAESVNKNIAHISTEHIDIPGLGSRVFERYKIPIGLDDGTKLLLVSYVNVTESVKKIESEEILNKGLREIILSDNIFDAEKRLIKSTREYLEADHCFILRCYPLKNEITPEFDNAADESDDSVMTAGTYPFPSGKDWFRKVMAGESAVIGGNSESADLSEFKLLDAYLAEKNVKSLLCSRIFAEGKLWGIICASFENVKHDFSKGECQFIEASAHLIEILVQRDKARADLMSALENAKNANSAKSFFLATMSHEIRTPLNAVIGFSELLKETDPDEETRREYIDGIFISGNALLQLINDVLDLSKLEAGRMQLKPDRTDISAFCHELSAVFRQSATKKDIDLSVNTPPMPQIFIDKLRLRQILFNLVGNAVKYTDSGKITVSADFTDIGEDNGTLKIAIEDTGRGITAENQQKIFEPFVQISNIRGRNASSNGTGLGLAITRRLVERMGGKMLLASTPGLGSRFEVIIPGVKFSVDDSTNENNG